MPDDILKTALAEAAGGAVAGAIADGVLYSIDRYVKHIYFPIQIERKFFWGVSACEDFF